ncbi:MAG TPA: ribonuclease III [Bacteroidia bacterium]|nr:ribonuclease III [Bacteroidia bacterium]HNT79301.1 ribonuclease III [Bacteroidia bacterium]
MLLVSITQLKHLFSNDKDFIRKLKNVIGFTPGKVSLYKLAFVHRANAIEHENGFRMSNERLEYLGDAILGAVVADELFKKFPYRDEGFLTEMRARIVSRDHLKLIAMKIGIDQMMQQSNGEPMSRSVYGDALEALIGAVYKDKGFAMASKFVQKRIIHLYVDFDELEKTELNFKSKILNWAQREKAQIQFDCSDETDSDKLFHVTLLLDDKLIAEGKDFSKKKAEQIAAEKACEVLGI